MLKDAKKNGDAVTRSADCELCVCRTSSLALLVGTDGKIQANTNT